MNKSTIVDWLLTNWKYYVGPAGLALAWNAWKLAWKLASAFTKMQASMQTSNQHIAKLATNDFPHIEMHLESISKSMSEMRDDVRAFLIRS